jgi:hypothetical protein
MEIFDGRGKPFNVGLMARYSGTGTIGEVTAVKVEQENGWIQLDHSDVWYNSESMEVLNKKNNKNSNDSSEKRDSLKSIEKTKKKIKSMEDVDMSSSSCDGAG